MRPRTSRRSSKRPARRSRSNSDVCGGFRWRSQQPAAYPSMKVFRAGRNVPPGICFLLDISELERGGAALSDSSQSSRIHPAALPAAGLAYEILIEGASISTNAVTNPVCVDRNRRSQAEPFCRAAFCCPHAPLPNCRRWIWPLFLPCILRHPTLIVFPVLALPIVHSTRGAHFPRQ